MNNPAPGASLNAVGTAPLHKLLSPPDVYSVLREVNVEGREVEFEGIERVDYCEHPFLISFEFSRRLSEGRKERLTYFRNSFH